MDGMEKCTTVLGTGEKSPESTGGGQLLSLNTSGEAAAEMTGSDAIWGLSGGENRLKFGITGWSKGINWLISFTLLSVTSVSCMGSAQYGWPCHT